MYLRTLIASICVWLATCLIANAGGVAPRSLVSLTSEADAIVVGSVEAINSGGTVSAKVQVERVLKGYLFPGRDVAIVWRQPGSGVNAGKSLTTRNHGLLFLKEAAPGSWSALPIVSGDIRWEDNFIPLPSNAPQAIRQAATASLPANASPLDGVLVEIVVADEAGASVGIDLVDNFRLIRSSVLVSAFDRFLTKQDPALAALGLRGSVATGNPSFILHIRRNYDALSGSVGWSQLLQEIKWYYSNPDAEAIRILGEIATDATAAVDLRIAVGAPLAKMHTHEALPYLSKLLDDQNITLQAMAVGGISGFANNRMPNNQIAPGEWKYLTDETIAHSAFDENLVRAKRSFYVDYWRIWWQQNQSGLTR